MKNVVVVGAQWGDEGKGKIVDWLSYRADIVVRYQGGHNAGHTLVIDGVTYKLSLLPSGVVERGIPHLAIGSGVVADPRKFLWEAAPLEKKGYSVLDRLLIDERTMASDLTHRLLDLAEEDYRVKVLSEEPRGSTGRGISAAYSEETAHWQMYFSDFLAGPNFFARKLAQRADRACRTIQHVYRVSEATWAGFFDRLSEAEKRANAETIADGVFGPEEFDFSQFRGARPFELDLERLTAVYWKAGTELRRNIGEVRELVLGELRKGRTVIGEFGQAYWLDKRHGFSPTSSHTFTPEFFESANVPVQPIHTFGVAKAYDTKVGTHTFLTEMADSEPLCAKLKKLEFGTSTGRQRMVGWYDAVEKGDALRYGGFQDLMINKLDALTWSDDWKGDLLICTGYEHSDGRRCSHVPRNEAVRKALRPVYARYPGWAEDISRVRHFADLPVNARRYVAGMVKGIVDVAYSGESQPAVLPNLRYLGVGPGPSQIIKDLPSTLELIKLA